tara:strand:+ start:1385 stop:2152 length:768 start_codon:yes stop_codon:yes gene_type:complete
MKKLILFIFCSLNFSASSQDIKNINELENLSVDPFEYIYLCEKNKIIKIENTNKKRLEYDFSKFGQLTKLITSNPLRTTLFFEESQTIIFLDKNLNKLNIELKFQNFQNNIISDIAIHSNLIFLLSEKNQEICTYDFKKNKITNCNRKIEIDKNMYLKVFYNQGFIILINNEEGLILDENLIFKTRIKLKNCTDLFFNNDSVYLNVENKLYKSSIMNMNEHVFIKNLPENNLFFVQNNFLFGLQNSFFWQEKLTK